MRAAREAVPSVLAIGAMLGLIFGGCCSNVYALEEVINFEPSSAITGYIAQFDISRPPFFLTLNKVPIRRWIVNIVLFFSINVLNNHAFSYDISVPVHIILRSGGSITTMAAGYLWGKKYPRIQAVAVVFLTLGVIIAAWSDAQAKGKTEGGSQASLGMGLVILFVAQVLSAIMGLYTEVTYQEYGPQWRENLFYSHILSLPLFVPFAPSMYRAFSRMVQTGPLDVGYSLPLLGPALVRVPSQLVFLAANVLTQYACIRGVNLLAAASSALTVTIVLNVRKLISLLLSIWLFGNSLAPGTLVGAVIVFSAGGLYSLGRQPTKPSFEKEKKEQ
ncbi:solute carrier family 35 (UDP-xylose/UDP-N-acetylglucosamine transporter), member B4 [Geosmithia morbida]|uniref:Solute carrier family 35 (UDP-xylose/UDP-N-acetylglucosamine transporter), member B4 n=1 Tax=Geosmithia morbida TaxID=1094350 RepID=A0A9P5D059_9HYPO|nr:solute carrier family 35 (UDP-xylose/UDP-N-acetylglucosamine transporter), member B4 [Geosmithia morbida]KAF4122388.1 solute carrier family 35 (UDP-xylose/UDP-N-acetylglucosamine transporter), member B4 [Geosmithia morbida]